MRSKWRSKRRSDATAGERSLAGHEATLVSEQRGRSDVGLRPDSSPLHADRMRPCKIRDDCMQS